LMKGEINLSPKIYEKGKVQEPFKRHDWMWIVVDILIFNFNQSEPSI